MAYFKISEPNKPIKWIKDVDSANGTLTFQKSRDGAHFEDEGFSEFINTIKSRTTYDYNVEVDENDKILTLSSCALSGAKRVVVHAKKLDNME